MMGQPAVELCEGKTQRRVVPLVHPDRSVLIFRVKLALAAKELISTSFDEFLKKAGHWKGSFY